jgi:hypothetical protein
MRNLLHRSQVGGARDFHWQVEKVEGMGVGGKRAVGFGWPEVADTY